jgi:hypothetical protein
MQSIKRMAIEATLMVVFLGIMTAGLWVFLNAI